jgi:hypothetical protein
MRQLVLDDIIQRIFSTVGFARGSDEQWQSAPKQCRQWQEVYDLLYGLPPETRAAKASSLYWPHIWLSVQRESWEEIKTLHTDGNEADIVDINEELEGDWQLEYPYEIDWFRAAFELVGGTLYFSLLPKESCLLLKLDQYLVSGPLDLDDEEVRQGFEDYTDWATTALRQELERLLDGSDAYRDALEQRLPKRERYGKLRRQDFWEVASDTEHFLRDELTQEDVARFIAISDGLTGDIALRDLTLNDFLRFCAICYEGAGYDFIGLTPRDQYLAKADGRHDGLLDITPTSSQALRDWFSVGHRGGHPWEIVRGGNDQNCFGPMASQHSL